MERLGKFKREIEREPARDIYEALLVLSVKSEVAAARREQGI